MAIHFYGERMTPETVVWHGVSRKMLFESFATYFECPTSTSIHQDVAASFSGPNGVILKLKSKFNRDCAVMFNVSVFSRFSESERLFVKETLIISDVLISFDGQWTSCDPYFEPLVYFEVCAGMESMVCSFGVFHFLLLYVQKITTGNATNDSWNIVESQKVQKTLALIIGDYIEAKSKIGADFTSKIPKYIRNLFDHYCSEKEKPQFNGIDQIQEDMVVELKRHIFISERNIVAANMADNMLISLGCDRKQKVSHEKVKLLFPNAEMYVNDQAQNISLNR